VACGASPRICYSLTFRFVTLFVCVVRSFEPRSLRVPTTTLPVLSTTTISSFFPALTFDDVVCWCVEEEKLEVGAISKTFIVFKTIYCVIFEGTHFFFFIAKTHVTFAQTFIVVKLRDFFISKTHGTFTQTFII
jgi:hypothetical protein